MKRRAASRQAGQPSPYHNEVMQEINTMRGQGMNPQQMQARFDSQEAARQAPQAPMGAPEYNRPQQQKAPTFANQFQKDTYLRNAADESIRAKDVANRSEAQQQFRNARDWERTVANDMRAQGNTAFANKLDRGIGSQEQIGGPDLQRPGQPQTQVAQAPAAPQQQQGAQNPYAQAQQSAMQQYPELAQAGSPMNKAFLGLVNQNGGSAALQKDPSLVARYAQQAQQQMAQNKAPAASPAQAPSQPTVAQQAGANKPVTSTNNQSQNPLLSGPATSNSFSGNVSLGLGGASQTPKAPEPGKPVAATNTGAAQPSSAPAPAAQSTQISKPSGFFGMLGGNPFPRNPSPAAAPAQPVAAANTGAPTKQGSMLSEFKDSVFEKRAEQDYLSYLREELLKEADLVYSKEEVEEFTSSRESFEKAAELEAQLVWNGLLDQLKKEGASEDFIEGFTKEAAGGLGGAWKGLKSFGTSHVMPAMKWVGNRFKKPSFKDAFTGAVTGGTAGGLTLGLPGAVAGGLAGAAVGGLGTGGAATLGAGALYGMGAFGRNKKELDPFGAPVDRHRVVPFMKNKYTGAAGGALLAHAIARESGLEGPMGWLLPILGGMVGHKYFPDMMNKWKDPRGYGINSIGSGAAMIQQPQNVYGG